MSRHSVPLPGERSTAHQPLVEFGVSCSFKLDARRGGLKSLNVLGRKFDLQRTQILFEAGQFRCPRDGNNPWLLVKQPGERDLSWCRLLLLRKARNHINQGLVRFPVLFVETRNNAAEIRAVELGIRSDFSGEEALAERAEWNEPD